MGTFCACLVAKWARGTQVDPNHFEFQSAFTNFEVEVQKSRGFKFKTLSQHMHWQQTRRCRCTVTYQSYDLRLAVS